MTDDIISNVYLIILVIIVCILFSSLDPLFIINIFVIISIIMCAVFLHNMYKLNEIINDYSMQGKLDNENSKSNDSNDSNAKLEQTNSNFLIDPYESKTYSEKIVNDQKELQNKSIDNFVNMNEIIENEIINKYLGSSGDNGIATRMKYLGEQSKTSTDIRASYNKNSIKYLLEEELRENENRDWIDGLQDYLDVYM